MLNQRRTEDRDRRQILEFGMGMAEVGKRKQRTIEARYIHGLCPLSISLLNPLVNMRLCSLIILKSVF